MRLQDQPVCNQELVRGFELGRKMALAARVARELEIEEVGSEALYAESRPITGRA